MKIIVILDDKAFFKADFAYLNTFDFNSVALKTRFMEKLQAGANIIQFFVSLQTFLCIVAA